MLKLKGDSEDKRLTISPPIKNDSTSTQETPDVSPFTTAISKIRESLTKDIAPIYESTQNCFKRLSHFMINSRQSEMNSESMEEERIAG